MMTATGAQEAHEVTDLIICCDATASMSHYLSSLTASIPQILALSKLTSTFESMGVLAYRDYGEPSDRIVEWSGWKSANLATSDDEDAKLREFSRKLLHFGGGDFPEAAKTAVHTVLENVKPGHKTLCIWYTDAPPHHKFARSWGGNREKEISKLTAAGKVGKWCTDWVKACKLLNQKEVQVISVLDTSMGIHESFYAMLAEYTRGLTVTFSGRDDLTARQISVTTMDILLAWLGQPGREVDGKERKALKISYEDMSEFEKIKSEEDHQGFLPSEKKLVYGTDQAKVGKGLKHTDLDFVNDIQCRSEPVQNFSKRFQTDLDYKKLVFKVLEAIINEDVNAISLNPVFGELWRVVCKDRDSSERIDVINSFSIAVGKMVEGADKENMKRWLEESYDQTKEVEDILGKVSEEEKYPAVMIDPTEATIGTDNWVRTELLEIGRSCYSGTLKKLGQVLTNLVYVENAESCPEHLKDDSLVPKLPLALVQKKYGRNFWKLLLHLVLPGTMLAARGGAVLAALCLKLSLPFLKSPADETLKCWKGKWADPEVCENWSTDFIRLLTHANGIGNGLYLDKTEASIFPELLRYKLAELNLDTQLTARIPFTPDKMQGCIGPTVKCRTCKFNRSVTMMTDKNYCGFCISTDYENEQDKEVRINKRADTSELGEKTKAHWVECGMPECRAAYVVYNPEKLNVRAKCFYCRFPENGKAPWVECKKCWNRVIWPEKYRKGMGSSDWLCVFCQEGRETTVERETTARQLLKENGTDWIVGKDGIEFTGRSVYSIMKANGIDGLRKSLHVLPQQEKPPKHLHHKPIHNSSELREEFASWVNTGRIETKTCNLCFESKFKPTDLHLACGRKGCVNKVDDECMNGWYGMNREGTIINLNALHCPFCRRLPTAKVLANYSACASLGNLDMACRERGKWIYAWCVQCSRAKRFIERVCQAGGAPPELENWLCEECVEANHPKATQDSDNRIRECPECHVTTQKTSGCNHITCPCGTHWCYTCGKKSTNEEIYNHMQKEHGGIYGAANDYDTDNDDY